MSRKQLKFRKCHSFLTPFIRIRGKNHFLGLPVSGQNILAQKMSPRETAHLICRRRLPKVTPGRRDLLFCRPDLPVKDNRPHLKTDTYDVTLHR
jgi:hypothetical protein